MRGESLRSKFNPSVSELMIKRVGDFVERGREEIDNGAMDDVSDLNQACDLVLCLGQWDSKAALKTIQVLTDLSLGKLDPKNRSSLSSHTRFVGRDRRALHADAELLDRAGGFERHAVVGSIAILDAQIVIAQIDVEIRQDQFCLDELPDDPGHLIAVELDDGVLNLDFRHALSSFAAHRVPAGL